MWAFLATPLGKLLLTLVLEILRRTGAVNAAEAMAIKAGAKLAEMAATAKIEPTYPQGKFGQPTPPPSAQVWKLEAAPQPKPKNDDFPQPTKTGPRG